MKVASLYCGMGGMDWGFEVNDAFDVIFAIDNDKDACKTYAENVSKVVTCDDIRAISPEDIPDHEVLLMTPPCQGFSTSGWYNPADSRNDLYKYGVDTIKAKKPLIFMMENVRGLMSMGKTSKRDVIGKVMKSILRDFKSCGYNVSYKLFFLENYGVPQRRRRVFIVGTRNDIPHRWTSPRQSHFDPKKLGRTSSFSSYLSRRESWICSEDVIRKYENDNDRRANGAINNTQSKYRVRLEEPCRYTILASSSKIPIHYLEPVEISEMELGYYPRRLTVKECLALQGFPPFIDRQRRPLKIRQYNDWTIHGSFTKQIRQVGNCVPPIFSLQIARSFLSFIKKVKGKLGVSARTSRSNNPFAASTGSHQ